MNAFVLNSLRPLCGKKISLSPKIPIKVFILVFADVLGVDSQLDYSYGFIVIELSLGGFWLHFLLIISC